MSARVPMRPPVSTALLGAGRLARSLGPALEAAGFPVTTVWARRPEAARRAARGLPRAQATTRLALAPARAELLLLAVADRALRPLARRLAGLDGVAWPQRTVLHHAGALGLEPLEPLIQSGAAVGLLHPLQVLGGAAGSGELLPGSRARIEGDRRGRAAARRLARALGLVPLRLADPLLPQERAAYHAAAALASNDLVALLSIGVQLLGELGLGRRAALDALLPLARGALSQLERGGLAAALTGPAARGDRATLASHREALSRLGKGEAEAHALLSSRLRRLARRGDGPGPGRGV